MSARINERVAVPLTEAQEKEVDSCCEFYTRKYRLLTVHMKVSPIEKEMIRWYRYSR